MKLVGVLAGMLIFGSQVLAADKLEIRENLRRIESELRFYDQSEETLEKVNEKLVQAIQLLRGGGMQEPVPPSDCRDFAFDEYFKDGYSNTTSLERARVYCAKVAKAEVNFESLIFAHQQLLTDGFSRTTSLNYALEIAKNIGAGSLECVKNAYEKYRRDGLSARGALDRASDYCQVK